MSFVEEERSGIGCCNANISVGDGNKDELKGKTVNESFPSFNDFNNFFLLFALKNLEDVGRMYAAFLGKFNGTKWL